MNKMKENKIIKEAIRFLENAPYRERKPYMKDYHGDGVEINGFVIIKDVWCWIIFKPTDIWEHPEFKGESLVKVVPRTVSFDNIEKVLELQSWTYL